MKSRILFLLLLTVGFNVTAQFSDPFEIEIDPKWNRGTFSCRHACQSLSLC